MQSSNVLSDKDVKDEGISMVDNKSHSLKTPFPMVVNVEVLKKLHEVNAIQFLNASFPIVVTGAGILKALNLMQL